MQWRKKLQQQARRIVLGVCALVFSVVSSLAGDFFTTNRASLRGFVDTVEREGRPVTILSFGDSMADSYQSITFFLMDRFAAQLGAAGYSLDTYRGHNMVYLSDGAEWVGTDSLWYGYHVRLPPGGAAWSVHGSHPHGFLCDSLTLFYVAHPNGGAFNLLISTNGGPWSTNFLSGYAASPTGAFTKLSLELNRYNFRIEGQQGTNRIVGSRFLNTKSPGLNAATSYYPGITIASILDVPASIRVPIFRELAPDLLIWHMKEDAATVRQGMVECEQWWAEAIPNCTVLYIGTPWTLYDHEGGTVTVDQNTIVRSVALEYGRPYVDLMTPAVSYAWMKDNGLIMADGVHLNLDGSGYLADIAWRDLGFFALRAARRLTLTREADSVHLRWATSTGIVYTVESSVDMATWRSLISSEGDGSQIVRAVPGTNQHELFRLRLEMPAK